jgi:hypothetical protein
MECNRDAKCNCGKKEGETGGSAATPQIASTQVALTAAASELRAIRQLMADRQNRYRQNIRNAANEQVKATQGYDQAEHFIQAPASPAFRKMAIQILEKDLRPGDKELTAAFATILQNAIWHLLDKLAQDQPKTVPEEAKAHLLEVFGLMKARGMGTSLLAKDWQGEKLTEVLPASASVVQYYRQLLEEA